jgi:hypothetical protein
MPLNGNLLGSALSLPSDVQACFGENAILQESDQQNTPSNVADPHGSADNGEDSWSAFCASVLSGPDALAVSKACMV